MEADFELNGLVLSHGIEALVHALDLLPINDFLKT